MRFAKFILPAALASPLLLLYSRPAPSARAQRTVARPVPTAPTAEPAQVALPNPAPPKATLEHASRIATWALARAATPPLSEEVERARQQGPHELLLTLEHRLRADPSAAGELLAIMELEQDPTALFQVGRALGPTLEDPELLRHALRVLATLKGERLAAGLVVLLGRSEPEVATFVLDRLEESAPVVRGRAGALLAHVNGELAPADAERARALARRILVAPGSPPVVVEGAAELLGQPGIQLADQDLLWRRLGQAKDPATVSALVCGLCLSGAPLARVSEELRRLEGEAPSPELLSLLTRLREQLEG